MTDIKTDNTNAQLVHLIQIAVDLCNSAAQDVKRDGYISQGTIEFINEFKSSHDLLCDYLDDKSTLQ